MAKFYGAQDKNNTDNDMLNEFGNSDFIRDTKILNFHMINDIFIDDND